MDKYWERNKTVVEQQVEIMMLRCGEQLRLGTYDITNISSSKQGNKKVYQVDILGDYGEFIVADGLTQLTEYLDKTLGTKYESHKLHIHEQEIIVRRYIMNGSAWYVTIIDADKCCNVSGKSLYYQLAASGRI